MIHHYVKDFLLGGLIGHSRLKVAIEGFKLSLWNEMSGNAPLNKLSPLQSVTCQAKKEPQMNIVINSREEVGPTDISEEADPGLRHGVDCVICGNSNRSMN